MSSNFSYYETIQTCMLRLGSLFSEQVGVSAYIAGLPNHWRGDPLYATQHVACPNLTELTNKVKTIIVSHKGYSQWSLYYKMFKYIYKIYANINVYIICLSYMIYIQIYMYSSK